MVGIGADSFRRRGSRPRFLEDWDGNLPKPWRVSAEGSAKASFTRGGLPGFTVSLTSGGGGGSSELGALCAGTFTVNAGSDVGPLYFAKGPYLLYIPTRSAITCRRASVLFTRFLASPGGMLPAPWRVATQTATFLKPAHPLRSGLPGRAGQRRLRGTTCPSLLTCWAGRLGQVVSAGL
ncbi:MAG TPA: hypothetical protein VKB23_13175 [Solirubrobacterales bacterium]|nr:hypothetical protein [Solirubrobacterales bacterium]